MLPAPPKQYYSDDSSAEEEEGPPEPDNDLLVMRGKRPVKNRNTDSIALDY
jgi:hypothetical protein